LRAIMFFLGVSVSHVFVVGQAIAFTTISSASTGRATTLYNATRQLGAALGIAVLSTVLAAVKTSTVVRGLVVPDLTSYHAAFLVAAGISLTGAFVALTIKDRDAAAATGQYRRRVAATVPEATPAAVNPARDG
ncbi:MAG TPA: hypothetical protein VKG43_01220, partial [Acidimicrobiales bacterium]|nr:hypothetical protein [Acidimicrobiales bacterium]